MVILSFCALLWVALPGVSLENLLSGSWPAVVDTLPVVALAFVYQNVIPVIITNLEGDVRKVRLAVWTGLAIPLIMFVGWEGAMLGSVSPGVGLHHHHCWAAHMRMMPLLLVYFAKHPVALCDATPTISYEKLQ
jgi:hypothetical protein